jgi:hypothetical protein
LLKQCGYPVNIHYLFWRWKKYSDYSGIQNIDLCNFQTIIICKSHGFIYWGF